MPTSFHGLDFSRYQVGGIKGAEVYGGIKAGFVSAQGDEDIVAKSSGSSYLSPEQVLNFGVHDNFNPHDLACGACIPTMMFLTAPRIESWATAMNSVIYHGG